MLSTVNFLLNLKSVSKKQLNLFLQLFKYEKIVKYRNSLLSNLEALVLFANEILIHFFHLVRQHIFAAASHFHELVFVVVVTCTNIHKQINIMNRN